MSNTPRSAMQQTDDYKPRPMIDLLVSIVLPSLILMRFSGAEHLGATAALIVALSLPLSWGLFELIKHKKFSPL